MKPWWAKLRSVDSTAALSDNSLTRAVDATERAKKMPILLAVWFTEASCVQSVYFVSPLI